MNARELALSVIRDSDSTDPSDLAEEWLRRVPEDESRRALEQVAREWIRLHITVDRRQVLGRSGGRNSLVRDRWAALMAVREFVPASSSWVRLGDATRADLESMADHRRAEARRNETRAEQYDRLAKQLGEGQRVSDLPKETLDEIF